LRAVGGADVTQISNCSFAKNNSQAEQILPSSCSNCPHAPVPSHRCSCAGCGSPFDTGFTALQTLFTGTVAKVASLIAIVIGGYGFAHGEPGAKKALAGVAAGTGIAVLAVNVLSWLWGV
jgi:type IV secretory pathway VirB2 component (pilin)